MIVLAVDPDTKCSGLAVAGPDKLYAVGAVKVPDDKVGRRRTQGMCFDLSAAIVTLAMNCGVKVDRIVVEGQEVYARGRANPNNLVLLAAVTGAALSAAYTVTSDVVWALPKEWKGQQPKGVNQRLTAIHYGLGFEFHGPKIPVTVTEIPEDVKSLGKIPRGHWKEVMDALGMCRKFA